MQALIRTASQHHTHLEILSAVERVNDAQKHILTRKVERRFGADLKGKRFAIWGLAFKANTDDMREAASRVVIADLLERGAAVTTYDPVAMGEARHIFSGEARVSFADSPMHALEGADALLIVTEWKEFRSPDFDAIRAKLRHPVVFDGRNLYSPEDVVRAGLEYHPVGRLVAQRA